MFDFKIFLVFALVNFSWPCLTQKVLEKVICPEKDYIRCRRTRTTVPLIHVVDVIYGRVAGLTKCGFTPTVNCTAPAYCEVAEKSDRRDVSDWLYPNNLKRDLCIDKVKYLIVKYRCLVWKDTSLVGKNFALKKPTLQSQTVYGRLASNAVDGVTSKKYWLCTRTGKQTSPWWRVDLEQRVNVSHVRIFNREILGLSLCGFQIRIGDSITNNGTTNARCGTLRHIPSNKDDVISCEPPLVGRYVTIVIFGRDKFLTLCEVEVYGTAVLGAVPVVTTSTTQPAATMKSSEQGKTGPTNSNSGEIPRCHLSTITIIGITSTSALVTWEPLFIPGTGKQHNNYSVTLSGAGSYYTKTIQHTFLLIDHLLPSRQYNVSVIAVGLQECYNIHVPPTSFLTAEAAPSGSPVVVQVKEVEDIGSITLSVTWSPPRIEKRNGKITNYSLCYSTTTLTADCNSGSIVTTLFTTATSIIIKGLETATIYFFRIRAYTKVGPGPCTKELNITTSLAVDECANKNICPRGSTCVNVFGSYTCECNEGYSKDETDVCIKDLDPRSCAEWLKKGSRRDGVYKINPDGRGAFDVKCDMTTDGGGWTVFQRRMDGSVNFNRNWADYKNGFGIFNGEFWLGLEKIHRMTTTERNVLRVDLQSFENEKRYAEYRTFAVSSERNQYRLSVGQFQRYSNAGDSLSYHNRMKFSTKDRENDEDSRRNCALVFSAAWWYRACHYSSLNGLYYQRGPHTDLRGKGVSWYGWKGFQYSLKESELKIRPRRR